ncbi:DivIVA domain-containing protein [Floricoccus penangensis]|uniref:DivIVA domain-containing protein n=1 Tax=Floricoccus penangensis TaxID=1859475 RepID=UPI0020403000|nr:DivIVA domain-containing protein [Floricoccus penangensis]URZ87037.1 DivIVA domain-containing protein [Floricoccus penangensis]
MVLNSLDIQNKVFSKEMRGYSKKEVEEFMDIIIRDYDEYAQKVKDLERENKHLKEKVSYFEEMKDSLNKSLIIAQDTSDNVRAQAESEADNILTDARQKSDIIIEGAKKEGALILDTARNDAVRLVKETDDLKRNMRSYHQKIQLLVQAQMDNINNEDWDEIFKPVSTYIPMHDETLKNVIAEALGNQQYTTKLPAEEIKAAAKQLAENADAEKSTEDIELDQESDADSEATEKTK